jgi:hypothetical protein
VITFTLLNEKVFVAVKEAAVEFGYSTDHFTRLAKTRKIIALQVGRRWFVQQDFLQNYLEAQKLEAAIRQTHLRAQRKQELALRAALAAVRDTTDQFSNASHAVAASVSAVLLLASLYLGAGWLPESGLIATVATADPVAVGAPDPTLITPAFTSRTDTVAVDNTRVVERPIPTPAWTQISP